MSVTEEKAGAYAGKKRVAVYVDPNVHKILKTMSLQRDQPIVHMVEAWLTEKAQAWRAEQAQMRKERP